MTFLPISRNDLLARGWDTLDVVLVTGDAYVDHPSYGAAVIGRVLEAAGFRVGIIAQPDWRSIKDFARFGRPRLFFGITAGNLDSMISNYTANKRRRKTDEYAPGGMPGLRPDRATIVYANRVRELFKDTYIVIGGIEASLRRFAHYDWWDNAVRRSILLDARADMLVFGMGEQQVVEIARRLEKGQDTNGIPGTALVSGEAIPQDVIDMPSYEDVSKDKDSFNQAFRLSYENQNPLTGRPIRQTHGGRSMVQFPPAPPLSRARLDQIYELPFERAWHPVYTRLGGIPSFETVRFSITSHRGCCGECSFCSLGMHQGRIIQSRSSASILNEAKLLSERPDFRGTITDMGGPTANLFGAHCDRWEKKGACGNRQCLMPQRCTNLRLGYDKAIRLYESILKLPGVKHLFIESGLRYDLLMGGGDEARFLKELCEYHVSGQLKVAPEHTVGHILALMNKPEIGVYEQFSRKFKETNEKVKKRQYLVNYFISAHPGSTLEDALQLSLHLMRRRMSPEQIQDFIPLPLTLSGSIFYTGKHPFTGDKVYVARSLQERKMQRALIQWRDPKNRDLIESALKLLNRTNLWPQYQRAWNDYDTQHKRQQTSA